MKLLLADCLASLAPEALPADPTKQIPWLNRVLETFFVNKWARTTMRWKGLNTAASFGISFGADGQGFFTLPRGVLSLLAGAYGSSGTKLPPQLRFSPSPINGPWFQFGNSLGVGDLVYGHGLMDAGDGYTTFADILEPSYLRVTTEQAEQSGSMMLFRGLDQNGDEIYTGTGVNTIQGVQLNISTGITTQTTQVFSAAPTLVKKPVTYGPVSIYAVSVATGVPTLIAIYDPGDTSPGFRRYKLGGVNINSTKNTPYVTVHAMVKRRFVPVTAPADEVIPSIVAAIELGFMAYRYDTQSDETTATEYWGHAFQILNSELNEFNGAAVPRIIQEAGLGLASIPWIN